MSEKFQTSPLPLALRWPARRLSKPLLVTGVSLAFALGALSLAWFFRGAKTVEASRPQAAPQPTSAAPAVVELVPGKQQAAGIHSTPLALQELHEVQRVPGTIGYNTARRVEVRLPVGGVLTRVVVQQGQKIKRGDQLAILTSTEVGLARTDVVAAEADVELARSESQWADRIADNLVALAALLEGAPDMTTVEHEFDDRVLGEHRDQVLSAYSKLLFARKTEANTDEVAASGGISGRIVQERHSAREVAAAQFKSALEQSRFDATQQQLRAKAALQKSERLLAVAQQKLRLLLGQFAEIVPDQQEDAICQLILRSPIDGIVEERMVTDGVHFTASQALFSITNPDTLWVSAHIYDRQWAQLNDNQVKELIVEAPAVPDHRVTARVLYTAVTTSAESGAVPLVAEFANADGHFKPGMFAWVSVPVSPPRRVLAVPLSAVTSHEQKSFVFIEEKPGTYRRVDVDLGSPTGEFVEVIHGLKPGEKVVDRGVFTLKSELLLGEVES